MNEIVPSEGKNHDERNCPFFEGEVAVQTGLSRLEVAILHAGIRPEKEV